MTACTGRAGWWKLKRRVTTEAIIGGIIGAVDDPRVPLLDRVDDRGGCATWRGPCRSR
ncbi:hypothetical protein [Actinoplanes auranticolor]|uniref:hypothetical protein n=1 Tax=Actinoplanes auranticolor TaxID=47988 RepID=UPI001BB406C0|nr:hypothetical protein [Actinoplanes auranticolor]